MTRNRSRNWTVGAGILVAGGLGWAGVAAFRGVVDCYATDRCGVPYESALKEEVMIVAAARAIGAGERVTAEDLYMVFVPVAAVSGVSLLDRSILDGPGSWVATANLPPDLPILEGQLAEP
jgi:flagella basal body P-ring formation protein FlgA